MPTDQSNAARKLRELGIHNAKPALLVTTLETHVDVGSQEDVVLRVTTTDEVAVVCDIEALTGVLAHRLEEPVAGHTRRVVGHDHRLSDQPGQHVEHVVGLDSLAAHDDFGGGERGTSREYRKAVERSRFDFLKEVVGPITAARNVWWRSSAVRRPPVRRRNRWSRRRPISSTVKEFTRVARELDRQWNTVELPTDVGHRPFCASSTKSGRTEPRGRRTTGPTRPSRPPQL